MVAQAAVAHIKEQRKATEIRLPHLQMVEMEHQQTHNKDTMEEPEVVGHQDLAVVVVVDLAQLVVMELLPMVVLAAVELQAQFLGLL
jgi:hypothetical protein